MDRKIKILVVDDHQLFIDGIVNSLNRVGDYEIYTTTSCEKAFSMVDQAKGNNPFDILFTDLSFDNVKMDAEITGGEDLIRAIQKTNSSTQMIVITGHAETNRVYNVIHNLQPSAYILKSKCEGSELKFAIDSVLKGERFYTHEIHQKLLKRNIAQIVMDDVSLQILNELRNHAKISNLEGVVLREDGSTIKLRTIEKKLSDLRIDLNAINNTDLVLKAKELGIID